jgi:hypothetical protein
VIRTARFLHSFTVVPFTPFRIGHPVSLACPTSDSLTPPPTVPGTNTYRPIVPRANDLLIKQTYSVHYRPEVLEGHPPQDPPRKWHLSKSGSRSVLSCETLGAWLIFLLPNLLADSYLLLQLPIIPMGRSTHSPTCPASPNSTASRSRPSSFARLASGSARRATPFLPSLPRTPHTRSLQAPQLRTLLPQASSVRPPPPRGIRSPPSIHKPATLSPVDRTSPNGTVGVALRAAPLKAAAHRLSARVPLILVVRRQSRLPECATRLVKAH